MTYRFINAYEVIEGINLLASELSIEISQSPTITVNVEEVDKETLSVSLHKNTARITYGKSKARFFRGLAILVNALNNGETELEIIETPSFTTNGAMVDMSRNAVMKPEWVKTMLRCMAKMGLNTFMLYTEDTYEIEERPYFGYMRGKYTKEEIRDLDAYASKLGIELVPCIQTLGHLATHLIWPDAFKYRDTENCLLIGNEETYKFIDDMFRTISECFTTKRIHIGMDEALDCGTGAYMKINGYRNHVEIFREHLDKVLEIAKKYNFEPMMWSDMFFRQQNAGIKGYCDYDLRVKFEEDFKKSMPENLTQVFWDYYNESKEFYAENIRRHRKYLCNKMIFAGGVWLWSGYTPLYSRSLRNSIPALDACKKERVDNVLATVWLNGGEGALILSLAGLAWYADYDYKGKFDIESVKKCFNYSCGASYDDVVSCEEVEYPDGGEFPVTRSFLFNDPLHGLIDANIKGFDTASFYKSTTEKLNSVTNLGIFEYGFDVIRKISSLLENKADFGVRLKDAYDKNDKDALSSLVDECDVIKEKIELLRMAHKKSWFEYYSPFGWEVSDIRYGGMLMRIDTAKERILDYLNGSITKIDELEEERLRIVPKATDNEQRFGGDFIWRRYTGISTPNILT